MELSDFKRYYYSSPLKVGETIIIEGAQLRHMLSAMRHKVGDKVLLFCGDGYDFLCRITEADRQKATLIAECAVKNIIIPGIDLHMFCGALKGDSSIKVAWELSELLATKLTFFTSSRTISTGASIDKLLFAAIESAKQCRRAFPMEIGAHTSLFDALKKCSNFDIKLIAYEKAKENISLNCAVKLATEKGSREDQRLRIAAFTGPEGGFSEEEIDYACGLGFSIVSMGKAILRAETAPCALAASIMSVAGEWDTFASKNVET